MIPTTYSRRRDDGADDRAHAARHPRGAFRHGHASSPHASGKQAPTYIDCRKLISHPRIRSTVMDFLTCKVHSAPRGSRPSTTSPAARRRASPSPRWWPSAWRCRCPTCARSPRAMAARPRSRARCRRARALLLVEDLTTDGRIEAEIRPTRSARRAPTCGGIRRVVFYYGIFRRHDRPGWPPMA